VSKPKHPERSASTAAGPVVFRAVTWVVTLAALPILIITPMTLHQQLTLSVVIFIAALFINRFPGRFPTLALIFLSVVVSSRYLYWRITDTMYMSNVLDLVLASGLLMAEIYAFVVLLLGYVQTA
jgi:cellulose synthase (UDP-forming)